MKEDILMLLNLKEISDIIKGLKIAESYISSDSIKVDEDLQKSIIDMLKKLEYVEHEYSNKSD
ncbi:hypothetical protein Ccar_15130 [Clostridium carboxidivorans P7]|uniref:Uncharacterized protein n=1 Tax=Clostridium carboxidivorans P7 TaxID=536227 RepID=C6Q212_9CLOT|nr:MULTISPECIES: hypothetical protein [Clostridium]AKN32124.1 hypothetical protein Ccar_15130 [Clostridium carboxidivorans P7]EET84473.1 conserved hypothetical protein [Clostridium carboxidivorans P7]WPC43108.1 hypothetical protein Q6H37_06440 [Clostridium sp. JS66]